MKKFILFLVTLILAGSLSLKLGYPFSLEQLFYHLLVMGTGVAAVYVFNLLYFLITRKKQYRWPVHLFNYLFTLAIVVFYLAVAGSNSLWGRPISLSLFVSYLFSLPDFVSVLPVKAYLVYGALFLLLVLVAACYYFVAPSLLLSVKDRAPVKWMAPLSYRKKLVLVAASMVLLLAATPLAFRFKRLAHFRGEPTMEFLFGQMWNSGGEETIFGKDMAVKGLQEKPCIDAVQPQPELKQGRITVVILFDGLRSDFLPAYGYQRNTTPFIDSLRHAGQLAVVNNVFSTSTTTLVGVAGLFGSKNWDTYSFTGLNLMKFLKIKGYTTYAFLTGQHRSWYGLTNIYRNDCDYFYESTTRPTEQNFDDFTTLKKFEETNLQPNSFVYIHLLSTHTIGSKQEQFRKYMPDKIGFTGNKKDVLINNYDNGILQGDYIVSQIFGKLKRDGLLDQSTVYILSDHGELFGEDGRWSHSGSIHPNLLKIPLLVYDQQPGWYRNRESATLKDVAPSIAARLGYAVPDCWEGTSLGNEPADFQIRLHAGSDCEHPEGLLTRKDSTLQVEIYNRELKPVRHFRKTLASRDWLEQKNEN